MNVNEVKKACFKYFDGIADSTDSRIVAEFISSSENLDVFRTYEEEWKNGHDSSIYMESAFKRLESILSCRRKRRITLASAAVAAIAGLVTVLCNFPICQGNVDCQTVVAETGPLERTKITLPDGSVAWLNSSSRLEYTDDECSRNVVLDGEAYFDVAKSANHPFVVNVADHSIKVKGTKFNVSCFDGENRITAALYEGSIEFSGNNETVEMIPGEILTYDRNTGSLNKTRLSGESYDSWRYGKIDSSSMNFSEFLQRVGSIYGVSIDYSPVQYGQMNLSIILSTTEPIRNVLDAVALIVPVTWTKVGENEYRVVEK